MLPGSKGNGSKILSKEKKFNVTTLEAIFTQGYFFITLAPGG